MTNKIQRFGESRRWADVVIHQGVARWVEVAENATYDVGGQIDQVLSQIDATLQAIGSDRAQLLQVLIYLADIGDAPLLNVLWDAWIPEGHAPVRACVEAGLSDNLLVEMVIEAAVTTPADA